MTFAFIYYQQAGFVFEHLTLAIKETRYFSEGDSMKILKGSFAIACTLFLLLFGSAKANPDAPTEFVVLSEVQITDSAHWAVEAIYNNPFQGTTLAKDSLTDQFSLVHSGVPVGFRPKIKVSSKGYAVITPLAYDSLVRRGMMRPLYFHAGEP